jgi:hypothetical protein
MLVISERGLFCDPGGAASWEIARGALSPAKSNTTDSRESMRIACLPVLTININAV